MKLTLKSAAEFVRTLKAPAGLLSIIRRTREVFTFAQERTNRLARYILIVRAYKRGKPVLDIEAEYGCTRSTVLRYARLAGLPKRPKSFEPGIRAAVIAMYKDGKPIAEISARLGVSQGFISNAATEEGINRRKFKKRKP